MPLTKEKKEAQLKDIDKSLKDIESVIFANFHGLSVRETTDLRNSLREHGCTYRVVKKTLLKRVLDNAKIKGNQPALIGEVAIAFSTDDPLAPARELVNFAKKSDNRISLLGGYFEGKYIMKEDALILAMIPSREILLSKFVNVINAPIAGFVGTLSGVLSSFVVVLNEVAKTKS